MRHFRKLRTVCALLFTMVLVILSASTVFAAGSDRVHDAANLFTEQEISELSALIEQGVAQTGMDMVVVTTNDKKGRDTQAFADEVYETGNFGVGSAKSGFLYLIDMEDRVPCLSTAGGAITLLSDSEIERLLNDAYDHLASGDYAGSAKAVIQDAIGSYEDAVGKGWTYDAESGIWSEPVKKKTMNPLKLLFSALISAFTAFGATGKVRREYAMKDADRTSAAAAAAILGAAGAAFVFANQKDDLLSQHTERRALPRVQNVGRGGSGGGGPHGPSTTHVSGGGMTHGGGVGRKF